MRTYKKRIITDVVSVGMLLLAVGLILLMHRYMGDVKSIYLPEAKTTGMPFNIGFRWSVILRNDWRNTDSSGYVCVDLLQ